MSRLLRSPAPLFAVIVLLSMPALIGAAPQAAADGAPPVFEVVSHELETRTAEEPEPLVALLRVDRDLIQRDPDALSVPLPDGGVATARRTWWSWISADEYHWFGELDGAAGSVAFHHYDGRLIGTVRTGEAEYRLVPEDGLHRMVRSAAPFGSCGLDLADRHLAVDDGEGPEAIGAAVQSISAAAGSDTDCFAPPSNLGIDVMVLYPQTLKGSAQAVQDYAVSRVAEANSLFSLSGVKISYTLTYVGPITGEQPPGPSSTGSTQATGPALDWLNAQFATPAIDTEVEMLRKAHGADMISIVVQPHPNLNCGIANLVEKKSGNETLYPGSQLFGNRAFSAVELNCGNADFTFAHELGHNYGMRHDPNPLSPRTSVNILDWAYGYILPLSPQKATVMGCFASGSSCSRIARFSNPDRTFSGVPTGLHTSQAPADPRHNACVANVRAAQYLNFAHRPPTSPPTVTITFPADGATVQAGVLFNLWAAASDPEDGDLRNQVRWTSDREGFLGFGSPRSAILTSKGPHLITATVTDSSGTTVPYSIRLVVPDTEAPRRWIDYPSHNQPVNGPFLLQGWATDASGVDPSSITFKVDGVPVTPASFTYGTARPDVCSVHGDLNDPNCPNVGFTGQLNASQFAPGPHTLTMTVKDTLGNTATFNRTFRSAALLVLGPSADAWVSEAQPNANTGPDTTLQMRASGSGLAKHTYMKFSVSGITRPVLSAKLRLLTGSTAFSSFSLYWMQDNSWSESTLTWNNASLAHYLNIQYGLQPANSRTELDVGSIVTGNGTYTFGMVGPNVPGLSVFSRNAHFTQSPRLEILY